MRPTRLASIAAACALAASLAACVSRPVVPVSVNVPPTVVYPTTTTVTAPASLEFGSVIGIEYFPGGIASTGVNVPGAIVGGVAGAVVGNVAGRAVGARDTATVLGGVAGAVIGSQAGRTTATANPVYRVNIQTDQGAVRAYDVPGTGDLRIGDRVRIENGVIYRA